MCDLAIECFFAYIEKRIDELTKEKERNAKCEHEKYDFAIQELRCARAYLFGAAAVKLDNQNPD